MEEKTPGSRKAKRWKGIAENERIENKSLKSMHVIQSSNEQRIVYGTNRKALDEELSNTQNNRTTCYLV